jgi:hypothetical protein
MDEDFGKMWQSTLWGGKIPTKQVAEQLSEIASVKSGRPRSGQSK